MHLKAVSATKFKAIIQKTAKSVKKIKKTLRTTDIHYVGLPGFARIKSTSHQRGVFLIAVKTLFMDRGSINFQMPVY